MQIMSSSQSRVFLAPRGAGCGKMFTYYTTMKVGSVSRNAGDASPIQQPDRNRPGRFVQAATMRGAETPWTTSLVGYKPLGIPSPLAKLAEARTRFDFRVHFGACVNLADPGSFDMAMVFEDVEVSDYNADPLGALNGGETAPVMETVNVSAARSYEIYTTDLVRVGAAQAALGGQIAGVAYGPYVCQDGASEPCLHFYALQLPLTYAGSAADDLFVLISDDGGITWGRYELDIARPAAAELIKSYNIAVAGDYIVIALDDGNAEDGVLYSIPISLIQSSTISDYSTTTISSAVRRLRRIGSRIYAVTDDGQVFWLQPSVLSPNAVNGSEVYAATWNDIHGLDKDNLLVGGDTGTLAHMRNGTSLRTIVVSVGGVTVSEDITAVAMKTKQEWLVGTEAGTIYCTNDAGRTWSVVFERGDPIMRLEFPTKCCGYAVTRAQPPIIYRTIDGGNEWHELEDAAAAMGQYSIIRDIVVCPEDPSVFVAVGDTADDSSQYTTSTTATVAGPDGFMLIGD